MEKLHGGGGLDLVLGPFLFFFPPSLSNLYTCKEEGMEEWE